ncbi:hypothetical protein KFL_001380130 [Klebsormidium nitens]|uniref:CAAX prenyl protease 2/Lysostaphin resistance protein A-like domain-containing protein n=1 Tax=Klebsormidium nitens TaxID=105231 RepID=A0A1Y1I1W8_KLENI|nr:hypothetical protein KFL_001380130 [Klebsormidium nitens]|eukprot:GAQ83171.1 hypothetical protein KFL_001380130 [Klebsormidium nitens]
MTSLSCHLGASARAAALIPTECQGQRLVLECPFSTLQLSVYELPSPSSAFRKARKLRRRYTTGSVRRFSHLKLRWHQINASTNCSNQDKHGADRPTRVRAGSQEKLDQTPPSQPTSSSDEGVVEETESETSIQGVVRPLILFLALRTGCEILGLRFVAELSGQPLTSLDPNLKATFMLLLAVLEYTGTYFLFVAPGGTAQSALGRLRNDRFRPQLVLGKEGWLYPALVGTGVLLLVPTASFLSSYVDQNEGLDLDSFGKFLENAIGTGGVYSALISFILVSFSSPLVEEAVFRGFFQSSLRELNMSSRGAIVVSSIAFSVAHLDSRSFVPLFILGFVLGTVYDVSGNLFSPFVVHVVYNSVVTLLAAALERHG